MLATLDALVPVFLTIVVGAVLANRRVVTGDMWAAIEHVCYYVLFPVLIIRTLATADLGQAAVSGLALVLFTAIVAMFALMFALRPLLMGPLGLSGPSWSSVFQASTRWHTFAALAIITALYGAPGLALGSIGIIALVPILNVVNVAVVSRHSDGGSLEPRRLVMVIVKNPFIWSISVGIAINLSGLALPGPVLATMDLIGRGALGLGLLTVGAGLDLRSALAARAPVLIATGLKLVVLPLLVALACAVYGVDGFARTIAIICGAVPTASTSYILARQLGGDATLIANTITVQVLASAVTLPVAIWLAGG